MIYAVIVNDLGLVGGCGLIATYLLIAERGFKTATLATDSFSKLLATGLTAVMALQVFVIIGGVTRVIPLTGVTLPFVSYGGSSIVANFVLLALLLLISNRARQPAAVNAPIFRLYALFVVLFAVLVGFSSRWAVFGATQLRENTHNSARRARGAADQARRDPRRRRRRCWPAARALSGGRYTRRYPTGRLFALAVGFDNVQLRPRRPREAVQRRARRPQGGAGAADRLARREGPGRRRPAARRWTRRRRRSRSTRSRAARARSSRSTSRPARCACWPARRPSTRTSPDEGLRRFNLATQGLFPPGSTFKTVTATRRDRLRPLPARLDASAARTAR